LISLLDKKIALIGGAGFIGHNLALALAERGAHVHVIDGLSVNSLLTFTAISPQCSEHDLYLRIINDRLRLLELADVTLHVQDAREAQGVAGLLRDIKPEIVVHLAGISNARQSDQEPAPAFAHTLTTLANTLEAARVCAEHVIYFSSSMVYGDFVMDPVPEDALCQPKGIYAALKLAGEHIVRAHEQVFGLPFTIVRPSALYGERCVSRRVIQVFIENAARGGPVTISGDGSDRLDFTYVADLVDGLILIMQQESARNEVFNLTYGTSRSISELADLLEGEVGRIRVNHQPRSNLLPKRGALSIEKARSLLGYAPSHGLETGLKKYVAWYRRMEPMWFRTAAGAVDVKPFESGRDVGSGSAGGLRGAASVAQ
jgi:nucleoside-diphosphate-sugar epimerase